MSKTQAISFPEDLHKSLIDRVKRTPGAKFSTLVVAMIRLGLAAEQTENANLTKPSLEITTSRP